MWQPKGGEGEANLRKKFDLQTDTTPGTSPGKLMTMGVHKFVAIESLRRGLEFTKKKKILFTEGIKTVNYFPFKMTQDKMKAT